MLDNTLQEIAEYCFKKSCMIVTAESCTGGLVAKMITDLPGSSQWFDRGFVTYSNQAKIDMLGVKEAMLNEYGAVSEAIAVAMAEGALIHSRAHYAVSITGIAGPDGGTDDKPVGTVCFAWASRKDNTLYSRTSTQCFSGDREEVRSQSAQFALQELLKYM